MNADDTTEPMFAAARERVAEGGLSALDLMGLAEALREAGSPDGAIELYRVWLAQGDDDPLCHTIWFNCAVLLSQRFDLHDAKQALEQALRLRPDFMPARINLGFVQERLGARAEAVIAWQDVVQRLHGATADSVAHKKTALKQLGRVLEAAHFDPNAEQTLHLSLELDPNQRDVLQHWLSLRQRQCEWPVIQPWGELNRERQVAGLSPLSLAAYTDDPLLQLANAARYARLDIARPALPFADTHRRLLTDSAPGRLRVGYLSSDLREHAIGLLMAELFEQHDPEVVEVFVYFCGPPADDAIHRRIRAATPRWTDIAAMDDEQAARAIVADQIAILVDVNGYTHGARSSLLAMRPAPVIVNWLGFPGTTGSPDHHCIIADEIIIPKTHEIYYSEEVLRLPCYQPNDRKRVVSDRHFSRAEAGLPEQAMVYCCFNGAHKITPHTWRRWMDILRRVPHGVLWLMDGVATTNERLRSLAARNGIAPERLVFAPRLSNPDHLARYPLADLFLDTSPYGAHTTASDSLWAGVPVLTLAGRSFAARVGASLVTAAGLPELVCHRADDYVAMAVALGHAPDRLAALRRRLRDGRDTSVLFDTSLLTRRLEELFHRLWAQARAGHLPRPDLSNLEEYLEIGVSLDRDDREMLQEEDYAELYRDGLARRDRISVLRPDDRLWPGATAPGATEVPTFRAGTVRAETACPGSSVRADRVLT